MTQQDAIRKAIACLRLAKSSNAAEAALAASKAQEIIDRFQLDMAGIDLNRDQHAQDDFDNEPIKDFGYEDPLDDVKYLKPWMLRLASVVARANACRVVYLRTDTFDDGRCRGAKIKVIGRPSDVNTVRYLHGYLRAEVVRLCSENCAGNSGTYKRQFNLGVVETIDAKLQQRRKEMHGEMRQQAASNSMALMRVNNAIAKVEKRGQDVSKWMKQTMTLKTGRVHGTARTGEGSGARAHGRKVGEQVRLTSAKGSLGNSVNQIAQW